MSECCYINNLAEKLKQINEARARKKEKVIAPSKWSSTLSGLTSNNVKQYWVTSMLSKSENRKCISHINALILLSAINELMAKYKLPEVKESELLCGKK